MLCDLFLAGRAVIAGPPSDCFFLYYGGAVHTLFTIPAINFKVHLKVAFFLPGVDIIADGGTAAGDSVFEHSSDLADQPLPALQRDVLDPARRLYPCGKKAFVGIDISNSCHNLVGHNKNLNRLSFSLCKVVQISA